MKKNLLSFITAVAVSTFSFGQISFTNIPVDSLPGGSVIPLFQGSNGTGEIAPGQLIPKATGSLTSVAIDAILNQSVDFTYANDLAILVTDSAELTTPVFLLQIGGFSNFATGAAKILWGCEPACDTDVTGTALTGDITLSTSLNFTGSAMVIWLANGYVGGNPPTNVGWWDVNSLTLGGITAVSGVGELALSSKVYPNPANDELNISLDGEVENVTITSMDGKVVATSSSSKVNVATLEAGMYVYNVTTVEGKVAKGNFIKK
jgi:hypothetical protein